MLGMYKIRSATTKPTGKNKFEAGRKGNPIMARLIIKALLAFDKAMKLKWANDTKKTRVAKFLESASVCINGTVPIVQSHKS